MRFFTTGCRSTVQLEGFEDIMQQESQQVHVEITAKRIAEDLIIFPVERSLSLCFVFCSVMNVEDFTEPSVEETTYRGVGKSRLTQWAKVCLSAARRPQECVQNEGQQQQLWTYFCQPLCLVSAGGSGASALVFFSLSLFVEVAGGREEGAQGER